ncbi:MAG TPA: NAD(P)H-quinone oxidoreductase [Acidimicrobiia bacterium]|jgi:putative PIG3 family NAD(P)H quinone oxidoreductase|nr:NAD(P)H-quinone oxidoreductase [Acidimicrobiia bacterium]
MRAVTTVGENRIEVREHPDPEPGPGEVLVRVAGAGLNRADLMQRAGFYPAPPGSPPDIPGLEFSGTVEALGADVDGPAVGTRVFGVTGGGGQAELAVVPAGQCALVPDGLDLVAMGGVPETFVTAHDAMCTQAAIARHEWMLVHAVGSGVGTSALQLAKAFGARVIGTSRTADKIEACRPLGLDHGIVAPSTADGALDVVALVDAIRAVAPDGVDVTLDLVAGAYAEANVGAAAAGGRIVLIGTLAGGNANLSILTVMQRRLRLFGTVLRPRPRAEKAAATDAFVRDVVPLLAAKTVAPVVEAVMPLADATAAYDRLATDATIGKIILAAD